MRPKTTIGRIDAGKSKAAFPWFNRRSMIAGLASMLLPTLVSGQTRRMPKDLIPSIPVFSWLNIGETTMAGVRGPIQSIRHQSPGSWYNEGSSEITGGTFMTVSDLNSQGMLGEDGLKVLTVVFDVMRKAQLAIFLVERGWNDARVKPLINRITKRYASMGEPVRVDDGASEASDYYVIFDLGRFIIEISIPQHGTFLSVYFTTKEIHERLRMADGTHHIFAPYLSR